MKKLDKEIKDIKITKEDLKQFTPERVIKDLTMVEKQISQINKLDENITEKDALKLKDNLHKIEIYLMNQYKDYMNLEDKDIDFNSLKIDPETFGDDLDTKE